MKCLLCAEHFIPVWTPENLFTSQRTCPDCTMKFVKSGECADCGKPGRTLCADCVRWRLKGEKLVTRTLYLYDAAGKDFMRRFKFLGDPVLIEVFRSDLKQVRMKVDWIVPLPLSAERIADRRYNQSALIAKRIRGRKRNPLSRIDLPASSGLTKAEREGRENPFRLERPCAGKRILLVDDVYTTGTTLHQAASVLRAAGAAEVCALTLFRSV